MKLISARLKGLLGVYSGSGVKEIFIDLPNLLSQRIIGAYLNKIDEKIRINNKINDNLVV